MEGFQFGTFPSWDSWISDAQAAVLMCSSQQALRIVQSLPQFYRRGNGGICPHHLPKVIDNEERSYCSIGGTALNMAAFQEENQTSQLSMSLQEPVPFVLHDTTPSKEKDTPASPHLVRLPRCS